MSRATAYRYVGEAVDVLSEQAPGLREALERAICVDADRAVWYAAPNSTGYPMTAAGMNCWTGRS